MTYRCAACSEAGLPELASVRLLDGISGAEIGLACTRHARRHQGSLVPLFRPVNDNVVILRDELKNAGHAGRIIIPDVAKDWLGRFNPRIGKNEVQRREREFARGLVLAVGPGASRRSGPGGITGGWVRRRAPMQATPGMRIVFRAAYEAASTEWRGLTVLHDFDVLGVEEQEGAAQ